MIVLSLVLVVAAAVSLLVGLFATESLTLIFIAIALCVASLALLFVGSRQRRQEPATSPGPVTYGAPPTSGAGVTGTRPVSAASTTAAATDQDEDAVIRKTTARDAATKRVAAEGSATGVQTEADDAVAFARADADTSEQAATEAEAAAAATPRKAAAKKVVKKAAKKAAAAAEEAEPVKKSAAKKTTKKAAAKKTAKKTAAKKAAKKTAAKKTATKKAATKKAPAKKTSKTSTAKKSAAKKTTGAAARDRLDSITGVGAAKRDALLKQFGSLEAIASASQDDIAGVDGFGPALAKRVKDELS